ncbi:MAG: FixH family protein [Gammaproteobacteria bacterium]|nr:FixH family protein [Gammaproteobacteria bacterium]
MSAPERVTRWQDEPLAWMVFAIPLGTILACAIMITIAMRADDGLVVDDYYKRGLEINKVLDREARASTLGLEVAGLSLADGQVSFDLHASSGAPLPPSLDVLLAHATRAEADQALIAANTGDGHYVAHHDALRAGPWYVDISTPEWRLVERVFVPLAKAAQP